MKKTAPKKKQHYVNNADFLAAIVKYKEKVKIAEEEGKPKPRVNNYIGGCFLKIATHLSYRPNFINYTYRDDMINDGIENCLQYLENFNPKKSKNPFAYFTQIIYYAFVRRIQKEKKQSLIKNKLIHESGLATLAQQTMDDTQYKNELVEFLKRNSYDKYVEEEALTEKQKQKQKQKQKAKKKI